MNEPSPIRAAEADLAPAPEPRLAWLAAYLADWRAAFGLALVVVAALVALLGPALLAGNPHAMTAQVLQPPSLAHPMGTDHLGRDMLARIVWGTRVSLLFALGATVISFVVGVALGALAGYFGGLLDHVVSRVVEMFLMLPMLFLIILMAALFGARIEVAAFVVGITIWPANARIARAQVLSLKTRAYVRAARASGAGHLRILARHILPNGVQPVIVNSTLQIGMAVLYEASLSFLGLGDPNHPSWGQMLREAQAYLATHWWYAVFPGVAIAWLVLGVTLVGDGINRVLNAAER